MRRRFFLFPVSLSLALFRLLDENRLRTAALSALSRMSRDRERALVLFPDGLNTSYRVGRVPTRKARIPHRTNTTESSRFKTDKLFAVPRSQASDFDFGNDAVAVFDDMLDRSVPFYGRSSGWSASSSSDIGRRRHRGL